MRLPEYLPVAITRLCGYVRADLDAGDPAAALASLQKLLIFIEQVVLDCKSECPPLGPPPTTGDARWDAVISAALLDILGPQWPEPAPLPEPWFRGVRLALTALWRWLRRQRS